jgi:hypothetical protein
VRHDPSGWPFPTAPLSRSGSKADVFGVRRFIAGLLMVSLGMPLVLAPAASASLGLETAGAGPLVAESEIWGLSTDTTIVTSAGIVRCPSVFFNGHLYRDRAGSASILGAYGGFYRHPQLCESSL